MSLRFLLLYLLGLLSPALSAEPLKIFVSVLPQKALVEAVGGDFVDVAVMVAPGFSPATYSPKPQQIAALAQADAYFRIGVPFEKAWLARLRAANKNLLLWDARDGLALLTLQAHDHEHEHEHGKLDPHVWTDPLLVKQMALILSQKLAALRPAQQAQFKANAHAFATQLDTLHENISELLQPFHGQSFMVFHPAWGYFAQRYGLRQQSIEFEGKQPGAKALAALIETAKAADIKIIFVQPQFDQKSAQKMAQAIGGHVVAIDPLAENYLDNLLQVAQQLATGMDYE